MKWMLLIAVLGCSRAVAPEAIAPVDAAPVEAVDAADQVSPADAPSAVTP